MRIIVVNDASPDQLIQKVKEIQGPRLVLVEHTINQGVGGATIQIGAVVLRSKGPGTHSVSQWLRIHYPIDPQVVE